MMYDKKDIEMKIFPHHCKWANNNGKAIKSLQGLGIKKKSFMLYASQTSFIRYFMLLHIIIICSCDLNTIFSPFFRFRCLWSESCGTNSFSFLPFIHFLSDFLQYNDLVFFFFNSFQLCWFSNFKVWVLWRESMISGISAVGYWEKIV